MKSKTSFFNGSVLKKDITRFLPVWALYTVFLFMCMVLSLSHSNPASAAQTALVDLIKPMAVLNMIYAAICATQLFGDLYVPKMCNAMHAMPMRRESWFVTHTAAGLLFSLIPNLLASLISMTFLKQHSAVAFVWLGAVTLQYLFFFGLALFCTMCAGNKLGMIAIYGILNFFSLFLYGIIDLLYTPLLYGVTLNADPFGTFSPVVHMSGSNYAITQTLPNSEVLMIDEYVASSWNYLYILAAIGVVLAVFAVLLYRHRQLERAGDLLAVKAVSPLFLLIITLASGMAFYFLAMLFTNRGSYLFLLIGTVVGFFAARMLTERTVRVFNKKSVLGFLLIAALTAGSLFVTYLDPMKLVIKVPDVEDVASCRFDTNVFYTQSDLIDDPEEIQKVLDFHTALCQTPNYRPQTVYYTSDGANFQMEISYDLKDGSQLNRRYVANTNTELGKAIQAYLSDWRHILNTDHPETLASEIQAVRFDLWEKDLWDITVQDGDFEALIKAVQADCDAGNMAQHHAFHTDEAQKASVELILKTGDPERPGLMKSVRFDVYGSCTNTLQVLTQMADKLAAQK